MKHVFERTVEKNVVVINGVRYTPDNKWAKYDGKFEGTKQKFYYYNDNVDFIFMFDCPENNGYYDWEFWFPLTD